jgi:RNA-directed DNA polymerase
MASLTRFLAERLKLTVNSAKSAVDRPWKRTFLGYSMTFHKAPRLRIAASSVAFFDQLGLISLQQELRRLNNAS